MALMFPCHVPMPPLSWNEHLWLPEVSPTNESFITTVFEHRSQANNNQELLRHLSDSVAAIRHKEKELDAEAERAAAYAAQVSNATAAAQAPVNIPDMAEVIETLTMGTQAVPRTAPYNESAQP